MTTTAVCIINYNTCDLLRECLFSIMTQTADHIVVVDNASTDESVQMVKTEFPAISLLALEQNVGYGAASNRGIARCQTEHIVLLNADTVMKPGALRALSDYLQSHPRAAIVGPRILNQDGTLQRSSFYFPTPLPILLYVSGLYPWISGILLLKNRILQQGSNESAVAVPWILGAALAFRQEQIREIGGFDERFFMYFEEVDLCYRLSSRGQQIHLVPEAEIIHVGGASTSQTRSASYIQFFASLARFYHKHYSRVMLTEMVFSVKTVAFLKLAFDFFLLQMTRDASKQAALEANLEIDRNLCFGGWHRRSNGDTTVRA
jgi:GT2 family glycosyltransferase